LTSYEKNPSDIELLNSIFRKVHTLKGSASFLGFKKLQSITHSAETLLDLIREEAISLNSEMIDALLDSFDCCVELIKSIEVTGVENSKDYSRVSLKFTNLLEKKATSSWLGKGEGGKLHADLLNEDSSGNITYPKKINETSMEIK
jgi:two-component system chemotaxis sensor kinase CheA